MAILFLGSAGFSSSLAGQKGVRDASELATATFAGGCFWCMEKPFEALPGVQAVVSGYTGGKTSSPTYESYAGEGHLEAVEVRYDPRQISYPELLAVFWCQIDPTDAGGQFVDRGHAYSTAIFYHTQRQKEEAEESKRALGQSGRFAGPIVTPILPAVPFYKAESYHQDYYKKNPLRYRWYRFGSGRDRFLERIWGNTDHDRVQGE